MATLQQIIREEIGNKNLKATPIPEYITSNLSPSKPLRPYQREALQYVLNYFDNDFEGKEPQPDLLFQMATGSGKTLLMAAMIMFLYHRGYRNFLFFVDTNNIVGKTKDNFFNPASTKYLFADTITIHDKRIALNLVDNFQSSNPDDINICLTTIQQLHSDMNNPKEGCLTYDDFASFKTVLISDEAHHLNVATRNKKGVAISGLDDSNWENTALRILNSNDANILLEFTATSGMDQDAKLAEKYEPKLIFDYALKQYRLDGYSKEVETVQTSATEFQRVLCAMVLSQFKLKLFESIGLHIKPVVMFKSKTITDNKRIFEDVANRISHLSAEDLHQVQHFAKDDLKKAFDFFFAKGISLENLALELKEDFSEDKLLIVDQQNIDEQKQTTLNNLEAEDNAIRCVFAVDMLNEGWDVLNLFDIVRMYETRDARNGKPGKTTIQEAQLIGRGARYMPFIAPGSDIQPDKRKFDHDLDNILRVVEKLHYHTAANSRYVDELRKALIDSGIAEETHKRETVSLKPSFKETALYRYGIVFANERKKFTESPTVNYFPDEILSHVFKVALPKHQMKSDLIFNGVSDSAGVSYSSSKMSALGSHVIRAALNSISDYNFKKIKSAFPAIKSVEEFITGDKFLAGISVQISGELCDMALLPQGQKLYVAREILKQLAPMIFKKLETFIGTKEFFPRDFRNTFKDHTLNFMIEPGSYKEFGVSMRNPRNDALRLDLRTCEWYAYDDCFGTAEEKCLIKYIESIIPKLQEKYSDIYLVRNELDLKIYAFDNGAAFEPDFVMFMRRKGSDSVFDNIQLFIEPKGLHLEGKDTWKEQLLLEIHPEAILSFVTPDNRYHIWGLPFFNENNKLEFDSALKASLKLD